MKNDSKLTSLAVLKCHHNVGHCGVQATLCNLWNNYWIVWVCQEAKSILKNGSGCKIIQKKILAAPETPSLPSCRVNCNHAFEKTFLEFTGPLFCKGDYSSSGDMSKCYVLLFTCLRHRSSSFRINHQCLPFRTSKAATNGNHRLQDKPRNARHAGVLSTLDTAHTPLYSLERAIPRLKRTHSFHRN